VIIRTNDLVFGVDTLELDDEALPFVDTEAALDPEAPDDVEARVNVGESTTIISDPRLGRV
jgi:hypothetical protein